MTQFNVLIDRHSCHSEVSRVSKCQTCHPLTSTSFDSLVVTWVPLTQSRNELAANHPSTGSNKHVTATTRGWVPHQSRQCWATILTRWHSTRPRCWFSRTAWCRKSARLSRRSIQPMATRRGAAMDCLQPWSSMLRDIKMKRNNTTCGWHSTFTETPLLFIWHVSKQGSTARWRRLSHLLRLVHWRTCRICRASIWYGNWMYE